MTNVEVHASFADKFASLNGFCRDVLSLVPFIILYHIYPEKFPLLFFFFFSFLFLLTNNKPYKLSNMANIAIIIYSMYQHVSVMAEEVKVGIESTGNKATIYQVPETLPEEVLTLMHAPAKRDYPIATPDIMAAADGVIFGVPTRFGSLPAQLKAFIDSTGGQWASGALYQKPCGVFVSTGSGSGKETTVFGLLSTLAHHGMIYVPLGYAKAFGELTNLDEIQGATPWGAGTIAASDGSRQPTENELKIAKVQGEEFAKAVVALTKVEATEAKVESKAAPAETKKTAVKKTQPAAASSAKTAKTSAPAEKKKNPVSRLFSKLGKLFD